MARSRHRQGVLAMGASDPDGMVWRAHVGYIGSMHRIGMLRFHLLTIKSLEYSNTLAPP
jgi:hypothetical protein